MATAYIYKGKYFVITEVVVEYIKNGESVPLDIWVDLIRATNGCVFNNETIYRNASIIEPQLRQALPFLKATYPLPYMQYLFEQVENDIMPTNDDRVMWIYDSWNRLDNYANIFRGVTRVKFLEMVNTRDFTRVEVGDKKNLRVTISFIARCMFDYADVEDERVIEYLKECNKKLNYNIPLERWNKNTTETTKKLGLSKEFRYRKKGANEGAKG
ncbi:MAG: hypothetical protein IJ650_05390 [Paludibacteraceae bacterium]|nr:hypothetical protein [Paludibacteraceae bacterium]